jgi:hypothetical protein
VPVLAAQLIGATRSAKPALRGRSRTLRVNYRSSHQIRAQADRLLGPALTDVDGISEDRSDTVSVFSGPPLVGERERGDQSGKQVDFRLQDRPATCPQRSERKNRTPFGTCSQFETLWNVYRFLFFDLNLSTVRRSAALADRMRACSVWYCADMIPVRSGFQSSNAPT